MLHKGYQYESTMVLDLIWCPEVISCCLKEIEEQPQTNFRKYNPYLHIYLCYTLCKNYFIVRYPVRGNKKAQINSLVWMWIKHQLHLAEAHI